MLSSTVCIARKLSLNIHLKFYIGTAYKWCSYISTYLAVCTGISLIWSVLMCYTTLSRKMCHDIHKVERCVMIYSGSSDIYIFFFINNNSVHENIILKMFYAWTLNGLVCWVYQQPFDITIHQSYIVLCIMASPCTTI